MKSGESQGENLLEKGFKFGRSAVIASGAAVIFGVGVLILSILAVVNPTAVSPYEGASGAAVMVEKVQYYLPYPGLLPDSPLYKFKALRDKIGLWLTWDEKKKAEKELFLADKRINAAVALMAGGKASLAGSTATKAEKYLEQAVAGAQRLTNAGKDMKSLEMTLAKAIAKHREILESATDFGEALKINMTLKVESI